MFSTRLSLTVVERLKARLQATRSTGPTRHAWCRPDCRRGSFQAMAQAHRRRLGQGRAPHQRRLGTP
ncbi:MAG: hypothetical protein HOV77_34335 [Hamadaea sp.]|uniref:hypothetical protein n=1 Tax=Hamadaea sp. TaxID=2024425 RepID=UPI0017CF73D6|nr:hypothetical protein [Hamadaea sp.]NUT24260.1 hypothetical protein [Hamadaea sp.]